MQELKTIKYLDEQEGTTSGFSWKNENGGELYLNVSGTFVATLVVEGKCRGEWYTMSVLNTDTLSVADTITTIGSYAVIGVGAFEEVRVGVSAYTSGKITAYGRFNY